MLDMFQTKAKCTFSTELLSFLACLRRRCPRVSRPRARRSRRRGRWPGRSWSTGNGRPSTVWDPSEGMRRIERFNRIYIYFPNSIGSNFSNIVILNLQYKMQWDAEIGDGRMDVFPLAKARTTFLPIGRSILDKSKVGVRASTLPTRCLSTRTRI